MKKLLILLLLASGLKAQTYLQLKQIQPAAGSTSVLVTNSVGVLTYTTGFPVSKWTNDVPYLTGANTSTLYLPLTYTNNPTWSGIVTQNSTAATSTVNGTHWYNGIGSGGSGFNFYSDDPTNLSFLFSVGNSSNNISYYADHGTNNWLVVKPGKNIVLSTDGGVSPAYEIDNNQQHAWLSKNLTTPVSAPHTYGWTGPAYTNQAASTEISPYGMAMGTIQYSAGALPRQRGLVVDQPSISFLGPSPVPEMASESIAGPAKLTANGTCTTSSGLAIGSMLASALSTNVINGYAVHFKAPTGAQNNYNSWFENGNVGIGTAAPTATLHVVGTAIVSSSLTAGATTVTTLNATGASALTGVTNTGTFSSSGASTLTGITNTSLNCSSGSTLTGIQNNGTMNTTGNSSLTGVTNTGNLTCTGSETITGNSQHTGSVNTGPGTFGTSTLTIARFSKGTGTVDIGEYTAGRGAVWVNQNTPSATNWAISSDASGNIFLNAPTGAVDITVAGSIINSFGSANNGFTGKIKVSSNTTAAEALDVNGNITLNQHIIGTVTGALTFTLGTGAGTGATATLTNCSDIAGTVSVTTAGIPAAASAVITLTFHNAYPQVPHVQLTPGNAATALLSGVTEVYPTKTTTTLILNSNSTGITTGTVYTWYYSVTQ